MKNLYKIALSFIIIILVASCSTRKDTLVNRSYHSVSTKYNVLYNGDVAFLAGLDDLNATYEDNYWATLPIEPLKIDKLTIPGVNDDLDNSPKEFEIAEEKAVKAIQKHSMLIARQERNSQIDAAYLLLGKARYYSKRFVPALDAFNYVIINYPRADLIDETRVWQAKTNIRLQNENMAVETLAILLEKESLNEKVKEAAHTTMAMAYVEMDSLHRVVEHLNKATLTSYNKEQTARNLFILGQLYRDKSEIDSSDIAFQQVIDLKKAPYKYKIHSEIEQAKNVENSEEAVVMVEELQKLIRNRDNRPYLDELFYRLGEISAENDPDLAIDYYEMSLQWSESNNFQKEMTYQAIGNLYFDKAQFESAGAFYDSVLQITANENTRRIRRLKRKRNNLDEVIFYGNVAKVDDSILNIVAMSEDQRSEHFKWYIEKLKIEDKRKQELAELQKYSSGNAFFGSTSNTGGDSANGKWYFYNSQAAGFGQQQFRNTWGNRPLEDNWRLSEKMSLNLNTPTTTVVTNEVDESKKYEISYYLDQIPSDPAKIDSITVERNEAYYNLGIIYQAQFKEIELAVEKLEKLLGFNPEENLALPTKYHLYKMYTSINETEKATYYKNEITTSYPESKYAKIILNPKELIDEDKSNSPESIYANVFYEYKDEQFESVIEKSTKAISTYDGEPIVPKFELLKAYAIGQKDGLVAFKEALDFVVINYPNTEEGKKALEVIETLKTKI